MSTAATVGTLLVALAVVILIGVVIRRMLRGWRRRSQWQEGLIDILPKAPDMVGSAIVPPTRGLYVGSSLAPNRTERLTAGDLGYRCKAVLTRYPEGILLERSGAGEIFMPEGTIVGIRVERALGAKISPGILVIRWRLST
ncbi:MAG: transporter, partial [Mycobacterium sp.]